MRADPSAAPLHLRALAGTVDTVLVISAGMTVIGGPVVWTTFTGRGAVSPQDELRRRVEFVFGDGGRSRRSELIDAGSRLVRILLRNRATPGERLLGIRWVDAATGGPMSLRRMLTRELLSYALRRTIGRINRPALDRSLERNEDARRRIEELRPTLGDDPEAMERAAADIWRETGTSCVRPLAPVFALASVEPLTALLSPRRQSLIERAAGVVVVRDRG